MTDTVYTIAKFLQENPDFFTQHADLFSTLEVPHPHQTRTISLGERQILTLRERLRDFEFRLAELVRNGSSNEVTTTKLNLWCARMLAEQSPLRLPGEVALGLAEQFNLQEVALRVWGLDVPAEGVGAAVDASVHDFANTLAAPYCGANTDFTAVGWLHKKPASLAMLSLRARPNEPAFGLMVLGSDDPERFASDMGTTFLQTVSNLASAALSRLKSAAVQGNVQGN
jgi:uncharacterized protein YigA (DUF484 family)